MRNGTKLVNVLIINNEMKPAENKILHLPILIEQDEDNIYIVSCPVFKGCHSYGKTVDDALVNIREVIDICLDEEKEQLHGINRFIGFREMEIPISKEAI